MRHVSRPPRKALSAELVRQVKEACNNQCKWCGSTKGLHVDHIKPLIDGGRDVLTNLQLLCKSCHSDKHYADRHQF